jgi:hypothetical protein
MARSVTIDRPDVVALIERAAAELTGGDQTELVSIAVRRLLGESARSGSLFGAHPGSVRVKPGVDLVQPVLDDEHSDILLNENRVRRS